MCCNPYGARKGKECNMRKSVMGRLGLAGVFRHALPATLISIIAAAASAAHAAAGEPGWAYGKRGWEWSNPGTGSYLWLGLRFQPRYNTHLDTPRSLPDYDTPSEEGLRINRARYKIGAGYRDWLSAYHEYDLRSNRLLDLRATWTASEAFHLRLGQWKPEFNRERVDSSGKQQFVERSIATYWFTIDRQWGLMASGRLWQGSAADTSWWAGVLGGVGRSTANDGGGPMFMGRWQWNYTGTVLPFSQSALKRYQQPHASLAFALVSNRGRYTRFSSDGGGQLPGYEDGAEDQYRIRQAMQEWAWQRGGLSMQQELHWKSVEDTVNGGTRNLWGGYAQVGWFPSERWPGFPENLELAVRGAYVDNDNLSDQHNEEYTVAANLFIDGHRNKFTLDLSYLSTEEDRGGASDLRWRLQWDFSI
jgi:phosphate-selective porin OprO/OprP